MAITDAKGTPIGFGDHVSIKVKVTDFDGTMIVRILSVSQDASGASAVGGYVSLTGRGRIGKLRFDPKDAELVLANAGEPVKGK